MITITDLAASRIKELRSKEGLTEEFNIRVAVEGGGCSGLMYNLDFASAPQENDMIFEDKGVKVMVDKKSILATSPSNFALMLLYNEPPLSTGLTAFNCLKNSLRSSHPGFDTTKEQNPVFSLGVCSPKI